MKLIDIDKLKADIRFRCSECAINGTRYCREQCTINNLCEVIDSQFVIAITDKPLAIINDHLIYMTDGHVNALLKYEQEQATHEACERIMHEFDEIHEWENITWQEVNTPAFRFFTK